MMLRKHILILLSLFFIIAIAAFVKYVDPLTVKNTVDMRNGPGSYYELVLRLNPGAEVSKISKEQQWLKVEAKDKQGWIPQRAAYIEQNDRNTKPDQDELIPNAQSAFDELADKESDDDPYASPAQVAAAVKGFATDFTSSQTDKEEEAVLEDFNTFINPQNYQQFRNARLRNWSWEKAQERVQIDPDEVPALNPLREQAGWGIANVIAQRGLVENQELQQYLTNIALVLAENSHRYETPVHVYILDSNEISGYAAPNGSIFVSKGALQIMQSETELAFFLAHELSHVVQNHGVKESTQRQAKIMAGERFQELEREVGNQDRKYEETEKDLNQLANEMYEYTVKDRLEAYEFSADYWGVIYMYRAGYHPQGGLDLLNRIRSNHGDFEDQIGHAKWEGTSLRDRIIRIGSQMNEFNLPQNFGHDFQNTFQQKLNTLEK